jgi:tetratricopeptide (TPR) repeat protein
VREVRSILDRASAELWLGRFAPALVLARRGEEQARAIGHAGLHAESLLSLAFMERQNHDFAAAERSARESARTAWQADDAATVARAFTELVAAVGNQPGHGGEANAWAVAAERELARTGDAETRAILALHRAINAIAAGDFAAAGARAEEALAGLQALFGPRHPRIAQPLRVLGLVRSSRGDYAGAEALHRRDHELFVAAYGPEHPEVAVSLTNIGIALHGQGKNREARATLEQALAVRQRSAPPRDPVIGSILNSLGNACRELGEYGAARGYLERALAWLEAANGPDHPSVARALVNLANVLDLMGEVETARGHYERALRIHESVDGPDHPDTAVAVFNLGDLHARAGRCREAVRLEERALAVWRKISPDHPSQGHALTGIAECELALGSAARAVRRLEEAEKLRAAPGGDPRLLAETRLVLARARWKLGAREAAVASARAALGSGDEDIERRVRAWLDGHGARRPAPRR